MGFIENIRTQSLVVHKPFAGSVKPLVRGAFIRCGSGHLSCATRGESGIMIPDFVPEEMRATPEKQCSAQYAAASAMVIHAVKSGEVLAFGFWDSDQYFPTQFSVCCDCRGMVENDICQGALETCRPDKHHIETDRLAFIIPRGDEVFVCTLRG